MPKILQINYPSGHKFKRIKLTDGLKTYKDVLDLLEHGFNEEEETYMEHQIERNIIIELFDKEMMLIDLNEEIKDENIFVVFNVQKKIEFKDAFRRPVDDLPEGITHLTFGTCFNQPVDNLPEGITHLSFGYHFNHLVDNLPECITHLTFGNNFNQPVDNLPEGITHLTFGYLFNHPVDSIPKTVIITRNRQLKI